MPTSNNQISSESLLLNNTTKTPENCLEVRMTRCHIAIVNKHNNKLKGFANIVLNHVFSIRDIQILEGPYGFYLKFPGKTKDGKYKESCFPRSGWFKKELEEAVLMQYHDKYHQQIGY